MPDFDKKEAYDRILKFAKEQAALNFLDSGIDVNFFDEITRLISESTLAGFNIDTLIDEVETFVKSSKDSVGGLQKFVSETKNDSLNQFNAAYNFVVTEDLGVEWYLYSGTKIQNTRPFCVHFVNDYFHKKEVEDLGAGKDPITGRSLSSEDLLSGRTKGTNSQNIFINRGGYNCRHFFSPISIRFVPKKDIKRNVKNGNFTPSEKEKQFLK